MRRREIDQGLLCLELNPLRRHHRRLEELVELVGMRRVDWLGRWRVRLRRGRVRLVILVSLSLSLLRVVGYEHELMVRRR